MGRPHTATKPSRTALALGVLGIALYVVIGWLYLGSALVVPYPWVYGMWGLWLAGLFVMVRVFRRLPAWTPAVAVGAVLIWVVIVQLGSWLRGWTA